MYSVILCIASRRWLQRVELPCRLGRDKLVQPSYTLTTQILPQLTSMVSDTTALYRVLYITAKTNRLF